MGALGLFFLAILDSSPLPTFGGPDILTAILAASHRAPWYEYATLYFHLAMRRGRKIAKVAMARRLAVRLYWMMRKGGDYEQWKQFGSHAGEPVHRDGVPLNPE